MAHFTDDGLLPAADQDYEWLRPQSSGDAIKDSVFWISSIIQANRVVFPAEVDGELLRPPDEHVLDHLVRQRFSGYGPAEVLAEFEIRPSAGTVAVVSELPLCNLCERNGRDVEPARYDTEVSGEGVWAMLCPACYRTHADGKLGLGIGQYLMLESEVSAAVHDAFEVACAHWLKLVDD